MSVIHRCGAQLIALCSVMGLVGCHGESELRAASEFVDYQNSPDALPPHTERPRDNSQAISAALQHAAQIRGLAPKRPVPSLSLDIEHLSRLAIELSKRSSDADNDLARLRFARAFGLVPADYNADRIARELFRGNLQGLYDPSDRSVYLNRALSSAEASAVELHELTHALQDQHFDVDRRLLAAASSGDATAALQSLAEGDATLAQQVATAGLSSTGDQQWGDQPSVVSSVPAFLVDASTSLYVDGLAFVRALYDDGGWAAVNAAWAAPPASTEQLLHPEKYRLRETWHLPSRSPVPSGCELRHSIMIGEQGLRGVLRQWGSLADAERSAHGWDGDRADIFRCGVQHSVVWQIRFDTSADAYEAAALVRREVANCFVSLVSDVVTLRTHGVEPCPFTGSRD